MRQLWLGKGENKTLFAGCHHMLAAQCGSDDAEKTGWLVDLIGLIMPAQVRRRGPGDTAGRGGEGDRRMNLILGYRGGGRGEGDQRSAAQ
eukprot:scaffold9500_cov56-Isochrysis_galbana.AAC.1